MAKDSAHRRSDSSKESSHNASDESLKSLLSPSDSQKSSSSSSNHHRSHHPRHSIKEDLPQIFLLTFLYLLQGIPLGLGASLPLILQNRKVSYAQQAIFSFVNWPFSLKLLWAPIVDSVYSSRFGRRKSWLVPTQYLMALFMYVLSLHISELLGETETNHEVKSAPNVYTLTGIFFALNFLSATQDIAVDGWALTMLSRKNVGWASTCNTVGQTAGYFLGNAVFLALESADFSNKYFRTVPEKDGLVTLSSFLYFWSIVFLVTTTLVMLLKHEKEVKEEHKFDMTVVETYTKLYRILRLKSVHTLVIILLTCKIAFAATDSATGLKLIENGVHKENIALLAIPLVPLQIMLPLVISKYTAGPTPLNIFLKAYPFRLTFCLIFPLIVHWTKLVRAPGEESFPVYYYIIIVIAYSFHQISLYAMFVATMSFHAGISDPVIGGTYMTLLNTLTNLGGNWPSTSALYLVDSFTYKYCSVDQQACDKVTSKLCEEKGGQCETYIDGYYTLSVLCLIFGIIWLRWGRKKIRSLQLLPSSSWKCR